MKLTLTYEVVVELELHNPRDLSDIVLIGDEAVKGRFGQLDNVSRQVRFKSGSIEALESSQPFKEGEE